MNVFLSLEAESTFSDAGYPAAQHHQPIEELKEITEDHLEADSLDFSNVEI